MSGQARGVSDPYPWGGPASATGPAPRPTFDRARIPVADPPAWQYGVPPAAGTGQAGAGGATPASSGSSGQGGCGCGS